MKNNQNGITLIALVITIIVLLILAGVAIAMLSGDNGLLNKASDASVDTAIGAAKDQVYVLQEETLTKYYDDVYVNTSADKEFSENELNKAIIKAINTNTVDVDKVSVQWYEVDGVDKIEYEVELKHTDGDYVIGDLHNGKITWRNKNTAKETNTNAYSAE